MKTVVFYLNNDDCSGVFSTFEKAEQSLKNCATRCDWVLVSDQQLDDFTWGYRYVKYWKGSELKIEASIEAFIIDEDNGV